MSVFLKKLKAFNTIEPFTSPSHPAPEPQRKDPSLQELIPQMGTGPQGLVWGRKFRQGYPEAHGEGPCATKTRLNFLFEHHCLKAAISASAFSK